MAVRETSRIFITVISNGRSTIRPRIVSFPLTTDAALIPRVLQSVIMFHPLGGVSVLRFGGQAPCTVPRDSPDKGNQPCQR